MLKKLVWLVVLGITCAFAEANESKESAISWLEMTPQEREAYWERINEQHSDAIDQSLEKFKETMDDKKQKMKSTKTH